VIEGWEEASLVDRASINPTEKLGKGILARKIAMTDLGSFQKKIQSWSFEPYNGGMKFRNGDTLVARITPCLENGKGAFVDVLKEDEVAFGSTEYIVVREKPKHTDNQFLYYFCQSEIFRAPAEKSMTGSSGRQRVQTDVVKETVFAWPHVPEQRAIAEVLSSLDDKIDLLHRQNATLEALAETLFRQYFIEEAQDDWEERSINSLVDIQSGFAFKSATFQDPGDYRLITIKGVQDGQLSVEGAAQISELPDRMPEYCKLDVGDVLLSLTGNVGRCCLVDRDGLLLNQRVCKLKPKHPRDRGLVYTMFRRSEMKTELEYLSKGTAQMNLSPIETGKVEFLMPDREQIDELSDQLSPLVDKVLDNLRVVQTLKKLRDTLLPKLMSGEVRVAFESEAA